MPVPPIPARGRASHPAPAADAARLPSSAPAVAARAPGTAPIAPASSLPGSPPRPGNATGVDLPPRRLLNLAIETPSGPRPLVLSLSSPVLAVAGDHAGAPAPTASADIGTVNYALGCIDDRHGKPGQTLTRYRDAALHRFGASSADWQATGAPGDEMEVLVQETNASVAAVWVTSETDAAALHFKPLPAASSTAQIRTRFPRAAQEGTAAYADRLRQMNQEGRAFIDGRPLTALEVDRIATAPAAPRRAIDDLQSLRGRMPRLPHEPRKTYVRRLREASDDGRIALDGQPLTRAQIALVAELPNYRILGEPQAQPLPPRLRTLAERFPLLPRQRPVDQLDELLRHDLAQAMLPGADRLTATDMSWITGLAVGEVQRAMQVAAAAASQVLGPTDAEADARPAVQVDVLEPDGTLRRRAFSIRPLEDLADPGGSRLVRAALAALAAEPVLGQPAGHWPGLEVMDLSASSPDYVDSQAAAILADEPWEAIAQYDVRLWIGGDHVRQVDVRCSGLEASATCAPAPAGHAAVPPTSSGASSPAHADAGGAAALAGPSDPPLAPALTPDERAFRHTDDQAAARGWFKRAYTRRPAEVQRLVELAERLPIVAGEPAAEHARRLARAAQTHGDAASAPIDIALVTRVPLGEFLAAEEWDGVEPVLRRALQSPWNRRTESTSEYRRRLFRESVAAGQPLDARQLAGLTGYTVKQIQADPQCALLPPELRAVQLAHPRGRGESRTSHASRLKTLNDRGLALFKGRALNLEELSMASGVHAHHLSRLPEMKGVSRRYAPRVAHPAGETGADGASGA